MKTYKEFISENISRSELKDIEKLADRLFSKFNIDVEFTKHFADRINDRRNRPAIDTEEMKKFFKKAFYGRGQEVSKLDINTQAVLNDVQKDLNIPFIIKWDEQGQEFDLVAKTIMRKKDFKSPDRKIRF